MISIVPARVQDAIRLMIGGLGPVPDAKRVALYASSPQALAELRAAGARFDRDRRHWYIPSDHPDAERFKSLHGNAAARSSHDKIESDRRAAAARRREFVKNTASAIAVEGAGGAARGAVVGSLIAGGVAAARQLHVEAVNQGIAAEIDAAFTDRAVAADTSIDLNDSVSVLEGPPDSLSTYVNSTFGGAAPARDLPGWEGSQGGEEAFLESPGLEEASGALDAVDISALSAISDAAGNGLAAAGELWREKMQVISSGGGHSVVSGGIGDGEITDPQAIEGLAGIITDMPKRALDEALAQITQTVAAGKAAILGTAAGTKLVAIGTTLTAAGETALSGMAAAAAPALAAAVSGAAVGAAAGGLLAAGAAGYALLRRCREAMARETPWLMTPQAYSSVAKRLFKVERDQASTRLVDRITNETVLTMKGKLPARRLASAYHAGLVEHAVAKGAYVPAHVMRGHEKEIGRIAREGGLDAAARYRTLERINLTRKAFKAIPSVRVAADATPAERAAVIGDIRRMTPQMVMAVADRTAHLTRAAQARGNSTRAADLNRGLALIAAEAAIQHGNVEKSVQRGPTPRRGGFGR